MEELRRQMQEIEDEPEDDFEVEIYSPTGHGMRLPYSKGKRYAQEHFGIDIDSLPRQEPGGKPTKSPAKNSNPNPGDDAGESGDDPNANLRFFDRRSQQRQSGTGA